MLTAVDGHIDKHQPTLAHLLQSFSKLRLQLLRLADADPDVAIGFRQIGHVLFIDIRRIGDDQIVLQLRQIAEQVGTDRRNVMDQAVGLNVVLGDGSW